MKFRSSLEVVIMYRENKNENTKELNAFFDTLNKASNLPLAT